MRAKPTPRFPWVRLSASTVTTSWPSARSTTPKPRTRREWSSLWKSPSTKTGASPLCSRPHQHPCSSARRPTLISAPAIPPRAWPVASPRHSFKKSPRPSYPTSTAIPWTPPCAPLPAQPARWTWPSRTGNPRPATCNHPSPLGENRPRAVRLYPESTPMPQTSKRLAATKQQGGAEGL